MEAVAAAASIAGIITLVFQSIDGLQKFKELFSDASSASKAISRLLNDINSLIQILENVKDILEQFEAQKKEKNFAFLDIKIADCSKDVQVWLSTARILRPSAEHGGKAWLRKFRLAVNKDAIQTIRDEIGRHRQIICLSLSVLGRNIDLDTSEQVYQLGGSLSQSLSNHNAQEATLQRIENYSRASLHSSAHSIRSLDTIRNELSRLEARVSGSTPSGNTSSETASKDNSLACQISTSSQAYLSQEEFASSNVQAQHASTGIVTDFNTLSQPCSSKEMPSSSQASEQVTSDGRSSFVPPDSLSCNGISLHASFSAFTSDSASNQLTKPDGSQCNAGVMYNILQQSLLEFYPPCVADYISLNNLLTLCSNHLELLHHSVTIHPHVKHYNKRPREDTNVTTPYSTILEGQIEDLQHALKASRQRCIQAGYSLSHIDKVLLSVNITHYKSPVSPKSTNSNDDEWKD